MLLCYVVANALSSVVIDVFIIAVVVDCAEIKPHNWRGWGCNADDHIVVVSGIVVVVSVIVVVVSDIVVVAVVHKLDCTIDKAEVVVQNIINLILMLLIML